MSLIPVQSPGHLYIGDVRDSKNKTFFDEKNISMVVNCTPNIINSFTETCEYFRIPVKDDMHEDSYRLMFETFTEVTEKIHEALENGKNVLVNCVMGQQRSCAVVAAYLLRYYRGTYSETVAYVKKYRREAFFGNVNFWKALQLYEFYLSKTE